MRVPKSPAACCGDLYLPHALDALVQARVRAGTPFAVLIREALSAYLADTPQAGEGRAKAAPAPTPADTRRPGRPSSPMRQQILAALQAHPGGLRAEELRVHIQARRPIGDTLQGMLKAGVIVAQGRGPIGANLLVEKCLSYAYAA